MFSFVKKERKPFIYAPVNGKCISIEDVPDQVFAQKMMGDGIAFIPDDNKFYAPCDGKIEMIAPTKHAIGLLNNDGVEILIHVGLDTVMYQGKGFDLKVKVGHKVRKGACLLSVDREFFDAHHVSLISPMVITNSAEVEIRKNCLNQQVSAKKDIVLSYSKK